MKINAAVTKAVGEPFALEEVYIDEPRDDEILVRIHGVGLCHTDLVARDGGFNYSMPAVFGHEGAGIVERVGSAVAKVIPGDRVVLTFLSCGICPRCAGSEPAYCHNRRAMNYRGTRADGSPTLRIGSDTVHANFFGQSSFASFAIARERNTVKVSDAVPLEIAGALGCGVQTGAGAVMRSMRCRPGTSIVILGGGPVGLSAVMGAVLSSCAKIILVEPFETRRLLGLQLGATHALDPTGVDLAQLLMPHLDQVGADYVLDTSGMPSVINKVCDVLAPRGTFGFVGLPPVDSMGIKLPGTLRGAMGGGFTFRGIVEGDSDPDVFIPELVSLYAEGRFPFDKMVSAYQLSDINQAVLDQKEGRCVKAMLIP